MSDFSSWLSKNGIPNHLDPADNEWFLDLYNLEVSIEAAILEKDEQSLHRLQALHGQKLNKRFTEISLAAKHEDIVFPHREGGSASAIFRALRWVRQQIKFRARIKAVELELIEWALPAIKWSEPYLKSEIEYAENLIKLQHSLKVRYQQICERAILVGMQVPEFNVPYSDIQLGIVEEQIQQAEEVFREYDEIEEEAAKMGWQVHFAESERLPEKVKACREHFENQKQYFQVLQYAAGGRFEIKELLAEVVFPLEKQEVDRILEQIAFQKHWLTRFKQLEGRVWPFHRSKISYPKVPFDRKDINIFLRRHRFLFLLGRPYFYFLGVRKRVGLIGGLLLFFLISFCAFQVFLYGHLSRLQTRAQAVKLPPATFAIPYSYTDISEFSRKIYVEEKRWSLYLTLLERAKRLGWQLPKLETSPDLAVLQKQVLQSEKLRSVVQELEVEARAIQWDAPQLSFPYTDIAVQKRRKKITESKRLMKSFSRAISTAAALGWTDTKLDPPYSQAMLLRFQQDLSSTNRLQSDVESLRQDIVEKGCPPPHWKFPYTNEKVRRWRLEAAACDKIQLYFTDYPAISIPLSGRGDLMVMKTEVTQGLYAALMGNNPSEFADCGVNCPVDSISWYAAIQFANRFSEALGLASCYEIEENEVVWKSPKSCAGWRLPVVEEWQLARNSGNKATTYPWGEEFPSCDHAVIQRCGRTKCSKNWRPQEVCSRSLGNTPLGICDMAGNVWEWLWDGPTDEKSKTKRWIYGNSFGATCSALREEEGRLNAMNSKFSNQGFRLVRWE